MTEILATTRVTSHTLVGGSDNPNCFSLAVLHGGDIRIVNMKLGPFERVRPALDGFVHVRLLADGIGVIDDDRVPAQELTNNWWCTTCTPLRHLPPVQLRQHLARWEPIIRGGRYTGLRGSFDVTASDEEVDRRVAALQAIGELPQSYDAVDPHV